MDLDDVLSESRRKIYHGISHALHTKGSEKYRQRPFNELLTTTAEATDGFYAALVRDDNSKINDFIERIAHLRLGGGFLISDVQRAFDLYRIIVIPMLGKALPRSDLLSAVNELNSCLTYTITEFSDYFQSLHEKQVREYAQNLEKEVARRTRELSESEAKYRILVEEIDDGYFVSRNGRILFANKAFCDMHGYTADELIGRRYLDLTAPVSTNKVRSFCAKRRAHEEAAELYTYYRLHKDGRSLPTENRTKLIVYQGEHATAGICRDITERVRMEQRMREAENLAHIGQLNTSLAHEIRNPLSSIKMGIQMLLKTTALDTTGTRTIEISAKEITRLERILEEMLDLAKPVSLNLEATSINSVIESCIEILKSRLQAKKILLKTKLSPRIMPTLLDKEKMEQVLINILLNAVEVLPLHGKISILTRCERQPQPGIRVDILDNGPGVDEEDLPYIFDPFFSKKKKGTGLGLANVKRTMEAHGGAVRAVNKRKGLCLTLNLPAQRKLWAKEEFS